MDKVTIKKIMPGDEDQTAHIDVTKEQSAFVSSPASILTLIGEVGTPKINCPFIIEASGKRIGFFTLNFYCPVAAEADPLYFGGTKDCRLESFIIDRKFQGKGFGQAALKEIVVYLHKNHPQIRRLKLSVNFLNHKAKSLYLKFGFRDTGKVFEGGPSGPQHIYMMDLPQKAHDE